MRVQPRAMSEVPHEEFEIGRIFVRQDIATMFERVVRVDAKGLLPLGTGILDPTQMTVTRRQQNP